MKTCTGKYLQKGGGGYLDFIPVRAKINWMHIIILFVVRGIEDRDGGLCCHNMPKCVVVVFILFLLFSLGHVSLLIFLSLLHKCVSIFYHHSIVSFSPSDYGRRMGGGGGNCFCYCNNN